MANDASGYLFRNNENITGQSILFAPSAIAREHYIYLCDAGHYVLNGEKTLQGYCTGYVIIYTLSGAGHADVGNLSCALDTREGIVILSGQNITVSADMRKGVPWEFVAFQISGKSLSLYYSQLVAQRTARNAGENSEKYGFVRFRAEEGGVVDSYMRMLTDVALLPDMPQGELKASTALTALLTELIINQSATDISLRHMPWYIEGIIKYVNDNYRRHITLDELAGEFNVSKFHLSREFKKYTGYSPNEYIITVRLKHAKDLLRNTPRTIAEIAQITGCGDVNHFIQLFKNREKVTPAVFRRRWIRGDKF